MQRSIQEPHGEPKYITGPNGVLCFRVTSEKLTKKSAERDRLLRRVEVDVLTRNEPYPVDMYCWAQAVEEDGSEFEDLIRVRFSQDWVVESIHRVIP